MQADEVNTLRLVDGPLKIACQSYVSACWSCMQLLPDTTVDRASRSFCPVIFKF